MYHRTRDQMLDGLLELKEMEPLSQSGGEASEERGGGPPHKKRGGDQEGLPPAVEGRAFKPTSRRPPTQAEQREKQLRQQQLTERAARQWKYAARERLARLHFARVEKEVWCRACFDAWLAHLAERRLKWRDGVRADGHVRFVRQSRGWAALRVLGEGVRRRAEAQTRRKALALRAWRVWAASKAARRQRLLCLDGYSLSSKAGRLFRRWRHALPAWMASEAQLVSMGIHCWARLHRLTALRRWRQWRAARAQQRALVDMCHRHGQMARAWARWQGSAAARRSRLLAEEGGGEERERRVLLLRKGLRALTAGKRRRAEGERRRRAAEEAAMVGRLRRGLRRWRRARAEALYWRRGALEAAGLLLMVGQGRRGLRRWAAWWRQRKAERARAERAEAWGRARGLRGAWRRLYRCLVRLRRDKLREKLHHATVCAHHRQAARVWEAWLAYVGERRRKQEGRAKGECSRRLRLLRRWRRCIVVHKQQGESQRLADDLRRQVAFVRGLAGWRARMPALRRQARHMQRAGRLSRRRRLRAAWGAWRRLLRPWVRLRRRHELALVRPVMQALQAYWRARQDKEAVRRAAIRWRRARAVQLAWHVWVGLVQRRGAEAAALSEGQAQARAWQAGRVVKRWRAWQLGRAGRREAGLAGERHWLVGWAERWRERAAARAVRRGEAQRLLAEAQQRRVRAGLFRWRAEADARGMRRAIATSKAAAGARAVQVLKLRRAMGRWVEWERRRAVKRIRGIRARARGQAALARAVWRAWVTYLLARRTVKQLARRTAAQRARARWRRGWRALARAVRQARHRMRRDAQALRAWKGARQRQGWAMWAEYVRLKRAKAARARAALEWNRHMLLKQGCLQWLETADWLRCQRLGRVTRWQVARTERLWAVVARCARHWRGLARRRRLEREGQGGTLAAVRERHRQQRAWQALVRRGAPAGPWPLLSHDHHHHHGRRQEPLAVLGQGWAGEAAVRSSAARPAPPSSPSLSVDQRLQQPRALPRRSHGPSASWAGMPPPAPLQQLHEGASLPVMPSAGRDWPGYDGAASLPLASWQGGSAAAATTAASPRGQEGGGGRAGQQQQERGGWGDGAGAAAAVASAPLLGDGGCGSSTATSWRGSTHRPPPRRPVELLLEASGVAPLPHWIVSRLNQTCPVIDHQHQDQPAPPPQPSAMAAEGGQVSAGDGIVQQPSGGPSCPPQSSPSRPSVAWQEASAATTFTLEVSTSSSTVHGAGGGAAEPVTEEEEELWGLSVEGMEAQLRVWAAEKARFEQAKKDLQQLPHGSITTNSSGSIRQQQPGLSEEEWQHRAQRLAQEYARWKRRVGPLVRRAQAKIRALKAEAASRA